VEEETREVFYNKIYEALMLTAGFNKIKEENKHG
jgi:hypothetical protein